ncbi:monosaccharide-sensing protein 2-like [Vicia villosa]|uniref:monosaccharide-sensing protein 2-like n=1 Tax=Vicia villosa TaxID=3911 RepID=UPI00273C4C62|nr:monosaccharide-sensing protein 2-like [Vicia villosa]
MREVIMVATAATLGNLLFGWDSSTVAGGMRYIKHEFHLESDPSLEGLIVSMSFLTGTIVTIFSGTVSDMFGRRPMLITSSLMFYLSGLVMLWAPNVPVILFSRLLSGIGIALAMTITPLYISEIAPPDIRGLLNTLPQLSCSMGMFLAYLLVFTISLTELPSWRGMLAAVSVYSVVYFFLAVFYLPESPPWLVSKGRISEAKRVLQRIRRVEDVSGELALLAEGMNPGGESIMLEEYIVAPASELISNKEAGKDCIKLYGPNQGEVSMIAQQVTGHGSVLTLEGSMFSNASSNHKDNIVNIFESMHENIPKMSSTSHMGDHDSDNVLALLLPPQGSDMEKDKDNAGEIPKNADIGGGWKLAYKSIEASNGEGGLQRVYLHADSSAVSRQGSASTSFHDLHADQGGETFQAAALVCDSIHINKDMKIKPEVIPKRTSWKDLLEPGVKRALVVGIGLQVLQQISGISGFVYYAPQILDQAGVGALLSDLGISSASSSIFVNVITTFCMLPCIALTMSVMDISGRRSILLYTIPILIVSLMILILKDLFHLSSTMNAALTAICAIVYESIFCMGYGVIPNIICSEIFPTSVRGLCISICSLTYWISTLIVTSIFPFLLQFLGITGVFGLFVAGCTASWIFIYLKVPETRGMPLEVIVEFFAIGSKPETR